MVTLRDGDKAIRRVHENEGLMQNLKNRGVMVTHQK
jgi:hypothetical protein